MTEREHQTGVLARGRGSVMVTGRDWARVGVVAAVAMALVSIAIVMSGGVPGDHLPLGAAVAGSMTALIGQPLVWSHGRHVVSGDASALPIVVGVALLSPATLLATAIIAQIIAFVVARSRLGLPVTSGMGRLKLAGNISVHVSSVAASAVTFAVWSPQGAVSIVVAATVAALLGDVISAVLLDVVVGPERDGPFLTHAQLLLNSPTFVVVSLVGALVLSTSIALGATAVWLALATAVFLLLSVDQAARQGELVRLRRLVEVTRDMPSGLERDEVLAFLADQARQLTHATSVTIGHEPPADGDLGVLVGEDPATWLQVHDRAGAGESFRRIERETLRDLGDMARLALRAVGLTERLQHEATHDALTGLLSRRGLDERWEELTSRAARLGHGIGVFYVDLDGFKLVNDEHGHAIGDVVLTAAAGRLRRAARGGDVVCRFGGDEFLVVAEAVSGEDGTKHLAERLRLALATPDDAWPRPIRASIGHAVHDGGDTPLRHVLQEADAAMYAAKAASRV